MMQNPIKLKKAMLFDCTTSKNTDGIEVNIANPVGNRVFILDPISKNLELFKSTIEYNIKKKLDAEECDNLAKKESKISALTNLIPIETSKGPRPKTIKFDIRDNTVLENILNSSTDNEFKQNTIRLANLYVEKAKNPKGVLGFVIFDLVINKRREKFLAILITDYHRTLSPDSSNAVKFLDKVFDQSFRDIIFYPHLVKANERLIQISKEQVKAYYKVKTNPDLLKALNIIEKIHPNKRLKQAYNKRLGEASKFKDLISDLGNDAKNAEIEISFNESKPVRIPLIDFLEKFKLIYSEKGEGLFIKEGRVKILIDGKEIRRDWWIENSIDLEKLK